MARRTEKTAVLRLSNLRAEMHVPDQGRTPAYVEYAAVTQRW